MKRSRLIIGILFVILAIVAALIASRYVEVKDQATENQDNSMAETTTVILKTNLGDITLDLDTGGTPATAGNFIKLAQEGFYDKTRFHRVIKGFMVQGGDPNTKNGDNKDKIGQEGTWGTGGPGYKFADEINVNHSNVSGTISMANSGPNTNGSQFFLNVADNTFLDGHEGGVLKQCGALTQFGSRVACHAVFGKVSSGMDIVMKISDIETLPGDKPAQDVVIESVEILQQ